MPGGKVCLCSCYIFNSTNPQILSDDGSIFVRPPLELVAHAHTVKSRNVPAAGF